MQIYIHRNKERFGPYSREAVLEYVKQGVFAPSDKACFVGMSEWKTVGELVGIAAPPEPVAAVAAQRARPAGARRFVRRRTYVAPKGEKKTAMIVLNLVLILIVIGAAYIRWGTGAQKWREAIAKTISAMEPAPARASADATPAAPLAPVVERTPAPAEAATPVPTPAKPFDPADLVGKRQEWPKTVRLKQATVFPVVISGQVSGTETVPAGSEVKVLNIDADQVLVDFNGQTQTVPWRLTDLEAEAKAVSAGGQPAPGGPGVGAYEQPGWK